MDATTSNDSALIAGIASSSTIPTSAIPPNSAGQQGVTGLNADDDSESDDDTLSSSDSDTHDQPIPSPSRKVLKSHRGLRQNQAKKTVPRKKTWYNVRGFILLDFTLMAGTAIFDRNPATDKRFHELRLVCGRNIPLVRTRKASTLTDGTRRFQH